MLPIRLSIEGLYSYQERQVIDFQNLYHSGLFGIFGAVGSGKSSILEAITFALYGETERLNSKDKRAYNMMNLKSNRSFIDFEFLNFEGEKFKIEREYKRNSKNFDDIRNASVRFFQWKNEDWSPREYAEIEDVIGLSYANFKRTIIIPQGQFKEFLELGAKDRTQMMKEIFNLNQYDLAENTKILNDENQILINRLEGELGTFENISEEKITEQKNLLAKEKAEFEIINTDFQKVSENFEQLKKLKTDWEEFLEKKTSLENLSHKEQEINILQEKTEKFEKIQQDFFHLISEKKKLDAELQEKQKNKVELSKKLNDNILFSNTIEEELTNIKPKYENLQNTKNEAEDLHYIIQIFGIHQEIEKQKNGLKNGNSIIEEQESKIENLKKEIIQISEKIQKSKSQNIDNKLIIELGAWYANFESLKKQEENQKNKYQSVLTEIQKNETFVKDLAKIDFDKKITALETEKKLLQDQKTQLEIQQELSKFSENLHNGKECPLCGSMEHPKVAHFENVIEEISLIEKQIQDLDNLYKQIQKEKADLDNKKQIINTLQKQLDTENQECSHIQKKILEHRQNFIWEGFSPENSEKFNEEKQKFFQTEKILKELEKSKQNIENQLDKERENIEKYNQEVEKIRREISNLEGQIVPLKNNMKVLDFENFSHQNLEEISEKYKILCASNKEIEEKHAQLSEKQQNITKILTEDRANFANLEARILELEHQFSNNEKALQQNLEKHQIDDLDKVYSIINQEINIFENRKIIQDFRIQFETLKSKIQDLEIKFNDKKFDNEEFISIENQYFTKEKERNEKQKSLNFTESELARLEKDFKEKENLLKDLSKLQKRADNLKVMTQLFKGAGFVQYVSSIYLRQLCDHANVRFHKMTRNSLSLSVNEQNDFEIIDYLNEGHRRSVKTLSGGQAFQVSLSLALALAESVQTKAKSDKNFFFIDEGFGTQDIDSVNVIFETLSNLIKENRIVGIISHLEELKEKIPMALSITKDPEKGSRISVV